MMLLVDFKLTFSRLDITISLLVEKNLYNRVIEKAPLQGGDKRVGSIGIEEDKKMVVALQK